MDKYIKTINGIPPDDNGNFNLQAGECISIETDETANSITINETCSSPCCGSDQLDIIREQIKTLLSKCNTLDGKVTQLEYVINALSTIITTV